MSGQVDVSNRNFMHPTQVDNEFLEFHLVSECTRWYCVLDVVADVDH